jgi:hypothetical protein
LVVTGFTLVACCHNVGSFLISLRRKYGWNYTTVGSWMTMWSRLKLGDRAAIENLCSIDKKLDRQEDLLTVKWLLDRVMLRQQERGLKGDSNCIILPLLDYGKAIPAFTSLKVPTAKLTAAINEFRDENRLNGGQYTRLYVPLRIGGQWLAVVCDMGSEKCDWVVFNKWEHELVRFAAQ